MWKFTGLAIAATCISAGLTQSTFAQEYPQAPAAAENTNMIGQANATWFARNLGIAYVPVPRGNGTFGLRLTAPPQAGSPASRLPLNAGDVIWALDGQPFTNGNDVANHHDQTTVDFFDAATNSLQRGTIVLAGAQRPSAAGAGRPLFARTLGVYYVMVNNGNGTFGLRLTAAPVNGSPASQLPLNPGDVILALDDQRFTNVNDVANHFGQTTVDFFDAATNSVQRGNINLPSAANASQSLPSGSAAGAPAASNAGNQIGRSAELTAGQRSDQPSVPPGSPPGAARPLFAKNLGIYYVVVNGGNGTFGLRLTAAPVNGSPVSQLSLDPGDVILALDGQRFSNAFDVANHFDQTTVDYFDAATNAVQRGNINLPSQNP